jgi:hypothetical protein
MLCRCRDFQGFTTHTERTVELSLNSVFQSSQLTVAGHGPHRTGGRGRWMPKRAISGRPSRSPRKRWPAPGSSPARPPTPW